MDMLHPSRNKNCFASEETLRGFPTHQLVSSLKGVVESRVGVPRNVTGFGTRPFLDLPLPAHRG